MQALISAGVPEADARAAVANQWDAAEQGGDGAAEHCFEVWPENWEAVTLVASLPPAAWDIPLLGGRAWGLRRDQVVAEMMLRGIRRARWPELWERVRVMEQTALERIP